MTHEGIVNLFRENPLLLATLAGDNLDIPDGAALQSEESTFSDMVPTEYRADGVLSVRGPRDEPVRAGVFEVQLRRDTDKWYTWPTYVTNTRCRLRCPVSLIVVTIDRSVARWCARPIATGHDGFVLRPVVIGPDVIPVVTAMEEAEAVPELAVLSVAAHGRDDGADAIALAALGAARGLDKERGNLYADLIYSFLSDAARVALENRMQQGNYEYQSDFARSYVAQGKLEGEAKGKAETLLQTLDIQEFEVPEALRERILSCTDLAQLDAWWSKVKGATGLADIFGPEMLED